MTLITAVDYNHTLLFLSQSSINSTICSTALQAYNMYWVCYQYRDTCKSNVPTVTWNGSLMYDSANLLTPGGQVALQNKQ